MLLNSCWCIFVFICLHFANIQATRWDVEVCYAEYYYSSVRITLNNKYVDISYHSNQKCFYGNFELKSGEMPSFIKVDKGYGYKAMLKIQIFQQSMSADAHQLCYKKATVENPDLPAKYVGRCSSNCANKEVNLEKWVHWNIAALFSEMNYFPDQFFNIKPDVKGYIKFRTNSRTSNTSFFLPKEMNTNSRIELSTIVHGKFWLDTIVTLKNMNTSKIYSCLYLNYTSRIPYHECSLINDSVWKIELTSRQELIGDTKEVQMFVRVIGCETSISRSLMFKKLAYLPTFSGFTNIGNINIGEIEISFGNKNKSIDISKIVMTRMLTEEEYGCANIDKTNSPEYSCKLLNRKQDEEEKQEQIHSTKTIPIMGTVIGILFLTNIIFSIRCMMLRNRRSRSNASTLEDVDEDNCIPMQNSTPVHISEPSRRLPSSQPNSLDVNEDTYCTIPEPSHLELISEGPYENSDSRTGRSAGIHDSEVYAEPS
ncbi:Hypothetical predicted protein [Octopus vulgaris]|uniref:Uncharacterized protein n=1 Tax=Octopus vulgaris TaxID=6645 RepID=A0AA36FBE4_OCTVU|nr:Hypothetical predicted protein [Octopus vulgaris]